MSLSKLVPAFFLSGCFSTEPQSPEEKYADVDEDAAWDMSAPPNTVGSASVEVSLSRWEYARFSFNKRAGLHYKIGLSELTGDLDLYGHWEPEVGVFNYQYSSLNGGTNEDFIEFDASQDGIYYLAVFGYTSGSGRLTLYVAEGDSEEVELDVPYLNQNDIPDIGWAACSSTSTAMVLAYHGKISSSQSSMIAAAEDVFSETANTSVGLRSRDILADYLVDEWGFRQVYFDDSGWEDLYSRIKIEIASGRPLILGSRSINSAGHYMVVAGYEGFEYEDADLILNDPNGVWESYNSWDTDASGKGVHVDYTDFTARSDDGVFVIWP
ncbi:MAG: C39 family peptidase [Verrucomicrobia bacterium]|nr:C39 family peptidase [Verrucomicrobiota bacterium]